jgi:hypothetical protein
MYFCKLVRGHVPVRQFYHKSCQRMVKLLKQSPATPHSGCDEVFFLNLSPLNISPLTICQITKKKKETTLNSAADIARLI